jgi:hypothetical protein
VLLATENGLIACAWVRLGWPENMPDKDILSFSSLEQRQLQVPIPDLCLWLDEAFLASLQVVTCFMHITTHFLNTDWFLGKLKARERIKDK